MRIAVFGASGRIGRQIVRLALDQGHEVRAFVRRPDRLPLEHERLTVIQGDVLDFEQVARAVEGVDAVVSALGSRNGAPERLMEAGMRHLIGAMEAHRVRRLVSISAGSVELEGDEAGLRRRIAVGLARRLAGPVVRGKTHELELIRRSNLDWIAVRPTRMVNGPLTGRYHSDAHRMPGTSITRPDVAHFMLRQLKEDGYLRQAPFVAN